MQIGSILGVTGVPTQKKVLITYILTHLLFDTLKKIVIDGLISVTTGVKRIFISVIMKFTQVERTEDTPGIEAYIFIKFITFSRKILANRKFYCKNSNLHGHLYSEKSMAYFALSSFFLYIMPTN